MTTARELAEKLYEITGHRDAVLKRMTAAISEVLEAAFRRGVEAAAQIASDGCLVPPDGGSPTRAEADMCDNIATAIRALVPTAAPEPGPEKPSSYRAEVKHYANSFSGVVCYFGSMREALDWALGWPKAVEVHIKIAEQSK